MRHCSAEVSCASSTSRWSSPLSSLCRTQAALDRVDQRQRLRDLVGEVERAALGLGAGEGRQDRLGDGEQGLAALDASAAARRLSRSAIRRSCSRWRSSSRLGKSLAQVSGRQMSLLAAARIALASLVKKASSSASIRARRLGFVVRRAELRGEFLVLGLADVERLRPGLATPAADVAAEHLRLDARRRRARRETEPRSQRGGEGRRVAEGREGLGVILRLAEQRVEIEGAGLARDEGERLGGLGRGFEGGDRAIARLVHQLAGLALVDHLEMRRDIGLERKELQKPLAEGVQCLDLEPARRLDRAGEQLPRELELGRSGRRPRPISTIAAVSASSSRLVQSESVLKMRLAMLAAAALVKVRPRICAGGAPPSRSRSTRWVRTCVLPLPALADTQAEADGSEAVACARAQRVGNDEGAAHCASPAALRRRRRRRPFLDPGQMVVVGEAAGEFRERARQIGRIRLGERVEQRLELGEDACRRVRRSRPSRRPRPAPRRRSGRRASDRAPGPGSSSARPSKPPRIEDRGFQRQLRREARLDLLDAGRRPALVVDQRRAADGERVDAVGARRQRERLAVVERKDDLAAAARPRCARSRRGSCVSKSRTKSIAFSMLGQFRPSKAGSSSSVAKRARARRTRDCRALRRQRARKDSARRNPAARRARPRPPRGPRARARPASSG